MVAAAREFHVAADREFRESSPSAVSWSSIIAGGITIAVVSLVLLLLGGGLGLSAVSPWSSTAQTAAAVGVGVVIWVVVTQWIAAGIGGYLTGRLRTKWVGIHTHETFFRDTAHGFLAWAIATLFTAALLGSVVSAIVGGTTTAATTVLAGAAQGAVGAAGSNASPTDYFVGKLFRADSPTGGQASEPAMRAESGEILLKALADGSITADDKTYLAQLVASRTGLDEAAAESRVDDVLAELGVAAQEAKQAADDARAAGVTLALVSFLSLIIGAFIAAVGAALGGRQRDEIEEAYLPKL